jgi:predicted ATP-grasp superfamily ATP-dependent carboligase
MSNLVFVGTTRPGIQALEAARRLGHHVTLLTSAKTDWMLNDDDRVAIEQCVDVVLPCGDTQDPDVIENALASCLASRPIDGVLTTFALCAAATSIAANRLNLRSTNAQGLLNARNKGRCRELLVEHGVPSVRFRIVRSAAEACEALAQIGYPAILKPTTGSGKALACIVHSEADVVRHLEQYQTQYDKLNAALQSEISWEFVVEEIARGPLYSIELANDEQGTWAPLAIVRRKTAKHNPVVEMGSTVPSGLTDTQYDEAGDYVTRVAKALGLRLGIFHTEFIWTADGPRLVEVNPRIAGGPIPDLIRTATGVNLFELLVRIHVGEPLGYHKLPCHTSAGHSLVGPLEDSVVRADLPEDWFEPFRRRLHSGYANIRPGQALRRMDGNFDIYGVLRVTGASYQDVVAQTERLRREVESVLQIKLVESNE